MPAIAAAVNAFKSEAVQQQVVTALLRAVRVERAAEGDGVTESTVETSTTGTRRRRTRRRSIAPPTGASNGDQGGKAKKRAGFSIVVDLNLRPAGKQSLAEFVAEKGPKGIQENVAAAVYWMQHIAQLGSISTDHIYTCFKTQKWRQPTDWANAISVAGSRHVWIDTGDRSNIKMTAIGENLIEHDLPRKKAK